MSMVAVVIGVALYAENIFSPILALAASGLSYLAFRSLHNLIETAHKVDQLGASLELPKIHAVHPEPQAVPIIAPVQANVKASVKSSTDATSASFIEATATLDAITMEMLKPSGLMTSDLIAQALKKELPPIGASKTVSDFTNTDLAKTSDLAAGSTTGIEEKVITDKVAADKIAADKEDKITRIKDALLNAPKPQIETQGPQETHVTPETQQLLQSSQDSKNQTAELAVTMSAKRPEIDTLSIDDLTSDLEAATQALEAELLATDVKEGDENISAIPAAALTPNMPLDSVSANATTPAEVEISLEADTVTVAPIDACVDAPVDAGVDAGPDAGAEPNTNADIELENVDEQALKSLVAKAVISSRAHIYLQPILGLATRRAESFEVLTHLENDQGDILAPSKFREEAERAGQMPALDNAMLSRTLRVLRKLHTTGAPGTMFCNLSIFSLSDDEVMTGLMTELSHDPVSAHRLVIELSEQAYLACTPSDMKKLEGLRELGVRLSMDQLTDAGIFMDALRSRMFAFIKIDAAFFLNKLGMDQDALMPAEILSEATLAGVDLVVEKIGSEADLEQVIGFGAKYGQGHIFSEPRPIKSDLLEDVA